jgi:hypothetical protein
MMYFPCFPPLFFFMSDERRVGFCVGITLIEPLHDLVYNTPEQL